MLTFAVKCLRLHLRDNISMLFCFVFSRLFLVVQHADEINLSAYEDAETPGTHVVHMPGQ